MGSAFGGKLTREEQQTLQTLNMRVQALEGEVSAVEADHSDALALAAQLEGQLEGTLRGALREAMQQEDAGTLGCVVCVGVCDMGGDCVMWRGTHLGCIVCVVYTHGRAHAPPHALACLFPTPSPAPPRPPPPHTHSTQLQQAQHSLEHAAAALQSAAADTTRLAQRVAEVEQRQGALRGELEVLRDALAREAQLEQVWGVEWWVEWWVKWWVEREGEGRGVGNGRREGKVG